MAPSGNGNVMRHYDLPDLTPATINGFCRVVKGRIVRFAIGGWQPRM